MTQTFNHTGGFEEFVVPSGVTQLLVDAWGAQGGPNGGAVDGGGEGGYVRSSVSVTPGETLRVYVGGKPTGRAGGFNGGGDGGGTGTASDGGGGGGATDLRRSPYGLEDRLVVAGGGGGTGGNGLRVNTTGVGGWPDGGPGADGGDESGGDQNEGGNGGTQTGGGTPNGAFGEGGDGTGQRGGGGGGGGWYGGGNGDSGVTGESGGGGGGGSGYASPQRRGWHVGYVGWRSPSTGEPLDFANGGRTGHGQLDLTW